MKHIKSRHACLSPICFWKHDISDSEHIELSQTSRPRLFMKGSWFFSCTLNHNVQLLHLPYQLPALQSHLSMPLCQHMLTNSSRNRGVQATHDFIGITIHERSADTNGNLWVESLNRRRDLVSWNKLQGIVSTTTKSAEKFSWKNSLPAIPHVIRTMSTSRRISALAFVKRRLRFCISVPSGCLLNLVSSSFKVP